MSKSLHAAPHHRDLGQIFIECGAWTAVMIAIAIVLVCITSCSGSGHGKPMLAPQHSPIEVHHIIQPPSAKFVAQTLNCTRFQDNGAASLGGVLDSGSCYIKGKKYGVDTFLNATIRNGWLKMSEKYGVSPAWESKYYVVYPSTDK